MALLAVGSMVETADKVRELLSTHGIRPTVVNVRFVKPLDEDLLDVLAQSHRLIVTMEENVLRGGFGQCVDAFLKGSSARLLNIGIPDVYVEHGNVDFLKSNMGLDADSVTEKILKELKES